MREASIYARKHTATTPTVVYQFGFDDVGSGCRHCKIDVDSPSTQVLGRP